MNVSSKSDQHFNDDYTSFGIVEKEAHSRWNNDSPQKPTRKSTYDENGDENMNDGIIVCNRNGMKEKFYFSNVDCESRGYPRIGDKVSCSTIKSNMGFFYLSLITM